MGKSGRVFCLLFAELEASFLANQEPRWVCPIHEGPIPGGLLVWGPQAFSHQQWSWWRGVVNANYRIWFALSRCSFMGLARLRGGELKNLREPGARSLADARGSHFYIEPWNFLMGPIKEESGNNPSSDWRDEAHPVDLL